MCGNNETGGDGGGEKRGASLHLQVKGFINMAEVTGKVK